MGWLGFAFSTLALVLNANHRRLAQVVFIVGNLMWLMWAIHQHLPEVFTSQVVYLILNIRTLRAWLKERQPATPDSAKANRIGLVPIALEAVTSPSFGDAA